MSELVAQIVAAFGLPEPSAHADLSAGWTTNLRLEVPGRGSLVARVHTHTPPDRLVAMQHARRAVAAAGIPAVPPLTRRISSSSRTGGWSSSSRISSGTRR